jgi:ketosteroid isomerase-like protein
MTLESNKALVRRYFEDAPRSPNVCDEIFQPRFTFRSIQHVTMNPEAESSPQSEKGAYEWLRLVWGNDWRLTVDEMIAEGDRVMVRWTFSGTQEGEYFGLPPTHKPVTYSGINIFRIIDGKIAEIADIYDRLWLWQQLGVLPETKAFIAEAKEKMR